MKLFMAGINYKNNAISEREKLSFSKEKIVQIYNNIKKYYCISGCVIISTCNRTEIYISADDDFFEGADNILLKCSEIGDFDGNFEKKEGKDAVLYVMELACGLKSQIVGEGQIVSQLNYSIELSRKCDCSDSFLNTLFRIAVSAGKLSLTNAKITNIPLSSAYGAVELIKNKYNNILQGKKCVVIGNGKMGQIVQSLLVQKGCEVFVTLRNYKYGNNEIVKGCKGINYNERYYYINGADFVISATKSPHFTITFDKLKNLELKPNFIIDLALPRDIEPDCYSICQCFNIDELGYKTEISNDKINIVYSIIEKFIKEFYRWKNYKESINEIEQLKNIIFNRISNNNYNTQKVSEVVSMTVDMVLGGMKGCVCPDTIKACKNKIKERTRF